MNTRTEHEKIHFVCFRWGARYGADYVNRLLNMVGRNYPLPHEFHCVTDNADHLDPDVRAHRLPEGHFNGNWNKLMMFQENFLGLQGELAVLLDLDIIILGDISFLADDPEKEFVIARNWAKGVRGNSSVYRLRIGNLTDVWNGFVSNSAENIEVFHGKNRSFGDQQWMNHAIPDYNYFPEGKIVSFKRHCGAKSFEMKLPILGRVGTARFGAAKAPSGAAVVLFHGDPLPPDVRNSHFGRWKRAPFVEEHWK